MEAQEEKLLAKIKLLNERIWEGRGSKPAIDGWLANFQPDKNEANRLLALYLLSHFMYFGLREIRELLKSMYRDLYKYPLYEAARRANGNTDDQQQLDSIFNAELRRTRFLGMGNPAESGAHLLYLFRQENRLPNYLFLNTHQIVSRGSGGARTFRTADVNRYVFIDDFCGTGEQATSYSEEVVSEMRDIANQEGVGVQVSYYSLLATTRGLNAVRTQTAFDDAECVMEMDDTYASFGTNSRYFREEPPVVIKADCEAMCQLYGSKLVPAHPLGYLNSQLLVGFHHNTPDNTLPIIWFDEDTGPPWNPIFRRYPKYEGNP